MKRSFTVFISLLVAACLLAGCAGSTDSDSPENTAGGATEILLSDEGIQVNGGGARAEGSIVTISAVGSYSVSGLLSDGQIVIDTGDDAMDVTLILNGVDVTNLTGPALHIRQAKNARVQLAAGTANKLSSGTEADMALNNADSSGAALYAEDDLDIEGEGSLEVYGYINNGIACKDDLDINSGTVTVLAANNGIRASESVDIKGGTVAVNAGGDGVKSTSAKKEGKGYVKVSGGELAITAEGDGISAETELTISGGKVTVAAEGNPAQGSSKAIKAQTGLTISGGVVTLASADHAVHSAAGIDITGGTVTASATDGKAIAAHGDIMISGGELTLSSAEDGIETPGNIHISGGTVGLLAGDDGLQAGEANTGRGTVTVSGGELRVSASGQAINARGQLVLDGGSLIALGGSNKAPMPTGSQLVLSVSWAGAKDVTVTVSGETEIASIQAGWAYKNVLVSTPALTAETDYTISNGVNSLVVRP